MAAYRVSMTTLASEYPRLGCEAVTRKRPGQAALGGGSTSGNSLQ